MRKKAVFGDFSGTALWSVLSTEPWASLGATRAQVLAAMHVSATLVSAALPRLLTAALSMA